jgi:hypothetical protein
MDHKHLISEECRRKHLTVDRWVEADDPMFGEFTETAVIDGTWVALDELGDGQVDVGEVGHVIATIVGHHRHHNRAVAFYFYSDGSDGGVPIDITEDVERVNA